MAIYGRIVYFSTDEVVFVSISVCCVQTQKTINKLFSESKIYIVFIENIFLETIKCLVALTRYQ